MRNYYKVDGLGVFLHPMEAHHMPFLCVEVTPPEVSSDEVAQWVSDVPSYAPNYGLKGSGSWHQMKDWRETQLYIKQDYRDYELGSIVEGERFGGLGELPDWLTDSKPIADENEPDVTEPLTMAP